MRSKITTKVNKYVVGHLSCNLKDEFLIYKTLIVELCCKLASVNLPLNYLSVNISRMLYCFPLLLSFISCSTNHIINGNKYVLHFL